MIGGVKPYPVVKHTGIEWLGDVPDHWKIRKLRMILRSTTERNRPDLPLLSVVREKGVIVRDISSKDENHNYIPDDLTNYKVVHKGQFAMNKMKAWQGSYGVSQYDGIVSPAYFVFDLDGVAGDFFNLAIRSKAYVPFFTKASDGVRVGQWDLSQARMREITFSIPPLPEQAAIVRFLDHVERRVRRLVRTKRMLITLLTEQKQAIIHRAVTRGLDSDVALRDSGVAWLGQIPEHWDVLPFKRVAYVVGGLIDPRLEGHRDRTLIAPNHIEKDGTAKLKKLETADEQGADSGKYEVIAGQIIYCKIRPYLRKAIIAPMDCLCSADMYPVAVRKNAAISYDFLLQVILSLPFTQYTIDSSLRAAMPKINREALGDAPVWLPPEKEQMEIVEYLQSASGYIDTAIVRATSEIELLEEYRTRIVADVVTGKLDVREAASLLPGLNSPDTGEILEDALDPDAEMENDDIDLTEEVDE